MQSQSASTEIYILPLDSISLDLETGGGKGANLASLIRAGFNVKDGFVIPASEYRNFISANQLQEKIQAILPDSDVTSQQELENGSLKIRRLFTASQLIEPLAASITQAYRGLGSLPVAVRSSATAEDLPEASFAGQQDTFLNVVSEDGVLNAVLACWGSFWTARAIGYRNHNHLSHFAYGMAVIVQKMVDSQVSGVMFTANPLSGLRSEIVIDAAPGLGEALVSGLVEPDHFVVDTITNCISAKSKGSKKIIIRSRGEGGTETATNIEPFGWALTEEQILSLAQLGRKVADFFTTPQDIEWAFSGHEIFLLQSRPITTLFPLPQNLPVEPLKVMFSFAAIQGMFSPMTKLGMDGLQILFATGAGLFGIRVSEKTQTILFEAGERLWVNFTTMLSNTVGRKILPGILSLIEPTIQQAVNQIIDDPRLMPQKPGISWHARLQIAQFAFPAVANTFLNLVSPQKRREKIVANGEAVLEQMEARSQAVSGDKHQKLIQRTALFPDFVHKYLRHTLILFVSGVAAGMASWNLLRTIALKSIPKNSPDQNTGLNDLIITITRGMPFNPTTEMDLALWKISKSIRQDSSLLKVFASLSARELNDQFIQNKLPEIPSREIHRFIETYGGRGLGEIDLGSRRWAEDSSHLFEIILNYLDITDADNAPDIVFARGADSARNAISTLINQISKSPHGWIKARLASFFARRARQLMGMRESPKFFAVRMFWIAHRELLKSGQDFVESGELDHPEDLFFLNFEELRKFASERKTNYCETIAMRRVTFQREQLRRQIPRILLSDGRAFYEGLQATDKSADALNGSPVSPGSVEGFVRVVLDPRTSQLKSGEIMVCPGTDPSWTPLFLSAGGLIMETGGMMTHGAVVAREYGIPAIVGVDKATRRLQTGQHIRMNGSTGQIIILK